MWVKLYIILLAYTTGPLAVGGAFFGEGRDPILLHGVDCNGHEKNLTQCDHSEEYNCDHSQDVGILCCGM